MNLPEIEKLLSHFHAVTGMDIAIIDSNFRVLARRHSGMDFCTCIHNSPKCLEMCVASDSEQMARVQKNKALIQYTCPFGIFEAMAPILGGGEVVACLFLSMGIATGDEELPLRTAMAASPGLDRQLLGKYRQKIPRFSPEKLDACAQLLPVLAGYIESSGLLSDADQSLGQMAKNYIKANLDQKITLGDLSYRLHCSTVTLTSHFKEEFGITVMEYVMEKRMNLAKHLLTQGDSSVARIAEKCGFSDPEYFSKCFRRHTGQPPLAWKRSQT